MDSSSNTDQKEHDSYGVIANLNHIGENVVGFGKVGNVISLDFNSDGMGDFILEKFVASNYFPAISAVGDFGILIITKVRIDYTENQRNGQWYRRSHKLS